MDKEYLQSLFKYDYDELCERFNVENTNRRATTNNKITVSELLCVICLIILTAFALINLSAYIFGISTYTYIDVVMSSKIFIVGTILAYIFSMCILCRLYVLLLIYPDIEDIMDAHETHTESYSALSYLLSNIHIKIIVSTLLFALIMSTYAYGIYTMYVTFPNQYKHVISNIHDLSYNERLAAISIIAEKDTKIHAERKANKLNDITKALK